jgi:Tol biopolymer transport system component
MPKRSFASLLSLPALLLVPGAACGNGGPSLAEPREVHLGDLRQLTHGGENAEAYWSPDGKELVFQARALDEGCDQIYRMSTGGGPPMPVSNGAGRTTCAYFTADGSRVLYSSTHLVGGDACPAPPDRAEGYVWPVYDSYEILLARPDGSEPVRLTENAAYDAESTVCAKDGSIVFTSTRDGDLELYRMDADGKNVRRLTDAPGYDGGAFFSPDCSKIVWRASRPRAGAELDDYRRLLAQGLVRPGKLELWTAEADGSEARQVTYLGAASFAPSFFPSGERVIFSSNTGDPRGREFDLWAVNLDGSGLERITWMPGFDGFPMFSPDGTRLAFASNRNQGAPGETNVFVAKWRDSPGAAAAEAASEPAPADRFAADVRWLAADAREGRGIGTRGLAEAADWLAARFAALGLEPAGDEGGFFHRFAVPVEVAVGEGTEVAIDGAAVARADFQPAGFSAAHAVSAPVVAAGYGITAGELGVDDYAGLDARGRVVAVRRFTPEGGPFAGDEAQRRYGDLRYKAWNAREHGAVALLVVDLPLPAEPGAELPAEAPLPEPRVEGFGAEGDAGIPVVFLTRAAGGRLFDFGVEREARIAVELARRSEPAVNVVGVLRGRERAAPVLVGAHYDHLGLGGPGSLEPDAKEPHNGADDNASGTAGLLEIARLLAERRGELQRDVWFAAFAGEERGVLGSTAFVRRPPAGLVPDTLVAMLNLDMVGRLRGNRLTVLGGESADEWPALVPPLCEKAGLACSLSGDGYGPSDHTPFYAAGVPILHFFTGTHPDYHRPSDDAARVNAAGGARVAAVVADVAAELSRRPAALTYRATPSPPPQGDVRSYGASLGTVPDYAGDGRPGVLLTGVRPGSPAEKGGLQRGDLLVELRGSPIQTIHDLMFVLRAAKPGEKATAVVERDGKRLSLEVVFGEGRRMR